MNKKLVFSFAEGDGKNKELLGGKGANLCEMTQIGLNVPPGFVITTEACLDYLQAKKIPAGLMAEIRDEIASVTRPVKELRGFASLTLAPGETQTVSFTLSPGDLSMLDLDLVPVVEPGFFTVFVGGSSEGGLQIRFEVLE